jgi:glycine oxidase
VKTFDVAIVGGGLIGVSTALELSRRKLRVVVFDRQHAGREASWAAAGMLAPSPDGPEAASLVPLARESLRLYPEFVRSIEEVSGKKAAFEQRGAFEIFFGDRGDGESARDAFVARQRSLGISTEPVPVRSVREKEPALGPRAVAAAWLPDEAFVDPRQLMEAALTAAEAQGIELRANCEVTGLLDQGGRCRGVLSQEGRTETRHVVIAAGCFSSHAADEVGRNSGVRPVRGQMLCFRRPGLTLGHVLRCGHNYLVPRADGRIVAGSTLEEAGFEKIVTPGGVRKITDAALEFVPALEGAEIVEMWAGLRPGTPDGLPVLGPTTIDGLILATGHYRNGILLAPITAKMIAGWVFGESIGTGASAFSPLRFEERAVPNSAAV